jgi:hypothetical protein
MPSGYKKALSGVPALFIGRFRVDVYGKVWDNLLNCNVNTYKDEVTKTWLVEFPEFFGWSFLSGYRSYELKKMVALSFKHPAIPFQLIDKLSVECIDQDEDNVHPSNLLWRYPPEGLEVPTWHGYYFIPGYSKYGIDKNDNVINLIDGRLKTPSYPKTGYIEYTLSRDYGGSVTITLHRIKGLTFCNYPLSVYDDVINHIDLDRSNNALGNYEWVTNQENIRHGRLMSRKPSSKTVVQVKNLNTDEVLEFESLHHCAKHFDTTPSLVYRAIRRYDAAPIFKQNYIIKTPDQDWPDLSNRSTNIYSGGRKVIVKNITTNEETIYPSAIDFIRKANLSKKVVTTALKLGNQREVGGMVFKYEDEKTAWK